MLSCPPQRLGCDNMLGSSQQEDPCLQCGGSGQSCYRVKNSFTTHNLPHGNRGVHPSPRLRVCELRVCDAVYFSFLFLQATTRCSSSLSEPRPSPSGRRWPLATTWVGLRPPTKPPTPPPRPPSDRELSSHPQLSRTCGANTTSTATG